MRRLFFILAAVLIFAGNIAAQNTAPVPTEFEILSPTADRVQEISGDPLPAADAFTFMFERPDTIPYFTINFEITAVDSPNVTFNYTTNYRGAVHSARSVTGYALKEFYIPEAGAWSDRTDMPDSTFTMRINGSQEVGNKWRISRRELPPGNPYWVEFEFEQDTTKGLSFDTSYAYNVLEGIDKMTLGFRSDYATPEVRFMLQVNSGYGWGDMNPSDSLTTAEWTNDIAANMWQYKDYADAPDARFYRLIRIGEAAADTGIVRLGAYIVPERKGGGQ